MSRTKMAIKNSFWALVSRISNLVLGFLSRTVFIYCLGEAYLGVNGVYSELLNMLSLVELGFGTALNFAMYKPVADGDEIKVKKLLYFYKTTYQTIAFIVALIGVALVPFLPYILKGTESMSSFDLRLYFIIFLTNTVIGYFVSYKFSYLNTLQKNYIMTNVDMIVHFVAVIAQILVLLLTRNFLAYLLIQTGVSVCSRIGIAFYLNKKYPIVKVTDQYRLTKEEKQPIYKEVKGLMIHQFSSVAVHSTDNIIISSLTGLGVVAVGLISNYNLIITSVVGFVALLFSSMTSGFGNLVATSTVENYKKAFRDADFLSFWIYGFCAIAFFVLIPPFITLWLGERFLIDSASFLLIVINNYLLGKSTIYNNARVAKGNFDKDKWVALAQAIVNLIVSIILANYLGLIGVYIGTVVSRMVTIIFRPLLTYKFLFEKSSIEYYANFLWQFLIVVGVGVVTYFATYTLLSSLTIFRFFLATIIVAILPNVCFFIFTFKSHEFKNLYSRLKTFIKREKRKYNAE